VIVNQADLKSGNELAFQAMNTNFFVSISNSLMMNWKEHMINWFEYVEKEWSRFQGDNELSLLNDTKIGETLILSPPLFDILVKSDDYHQKTRGLFSPYLMEQIQLHGYDRSFPFEEAEIKERTSFQSNAKQPTPFTFNKAELSVTRVANGKVDLGGIGKGYAVESAANWLQRIADATSGIVDGGGDISVWSNGEKDWKIGIADPYDQNKEIKQITLKNGSVATSNIVYRSWKQGNEMKHHILNGRTGLPVDTGIVQATVVTSNCLDAEVCAKLCFMENGPALEKLLSDINSNYKAVLIQRDGNLIIM
jgi:thiamine biosynthesis lipoprotein